MATTYQTTVRLDGLDVSPHREDQLASTLVTRLPDDSRVELARRLGGRLTMQIVMSLDRDDASQAQRDAFELCRQALTDVGLPVPDPDRAEVDVRSSS